MTRDFTRAVGVCGLLYCSDLHAEPENFVGTFMRGPERQVNSYDIECRDDGYQLAFEETGHSIQAKVRLIRLTRESEKISTIQFTKAARLFSEFCYISSISYSCGIGERIQGADDIAPRKFLNIRIKGGHRRSFEKAKDECLAKGWNFDFDTERHIRIEGDLVEIIGDKIGYCYGETEYFTVPVSTDDGDRSR